MNKLDRLYWRLQVSGALVIVSQALCIWIFLHNLLHFHDHPAWLLWLDCLLLPACILTTGRMGWLMGGAYRDRKRYAALSARFRQLGDAVLTPTPDELEQYIKGIEELDPAMGADLRKNLQEWLPK